jgi:hypothetical protein
VLRSELRASREQHGPKATLALVIRTHLGEANPADTLRVALMKLRITQQGTLPVAEAGSFLELVTEEEFAGIYPCPNCSSHDAAEGPALRPVSANGARRRLAMLDTGAQKTRLSYEDLIYQ